MKYKKGDLVLLDEYRIGKIEIIFEEEKDYIVNVYNVDTKDVYSSFVSDEDIIERIDL